MAGRFGRASVAGVSLAAATAKTVAQLIAAANHAVRLVEVTITFHGTNNTHEPILVELVRQSTAGTMTALTPVKADNGISDALDTTAQHTATAEPTTGDVLVPLSIHPQTGLIYQLHDLAGFMVAANTRAGLRVTAPNANTCDVSIGFEE